MRDKIILLLVGIFLISSSLSLVGAAGIKERLPVFESRLGKVRKLRK